MGTANAEVFHRAQRGAVLAKRLPTKKDRRCRALKVDAMENSLSRMLDRVVAPRTRDEGVEGRHKGYRGP